MFSSASSGSDLDGTDPLSMLARGEDVSSIPSFGRKRLVRIVNEIMFVISFNKKLT